jgi:hypothetical protein
MADSLSRRFAEYVEYAEDNQTTTFKMIPRIKKLVPQDDFTLYVEFDDNHKVIYDVKEDIRDIEAFSCLRDEHGLFPQVQLDTSRTCVYWNDEIDLASDSIYEYGRPIQ